jgi:hypothetical protein
VRGWRTSALLFAGVLLAYLVNGRHIGTVDTIGSQLLPIAIVRGDGPVLDRFAAEVEGEYWVEAHGGSLYSRYPLLPALVAVPPTWLQVKLLDRLVPGWTDPAVERRWIALVAKTCAALVAALAALCFQRLLLALGLGAVAVPTTLAVALGSDLWVIASQSPWQHGSAALFLVLALWLLAPASVSRARLAAGGLAAALAVCARPTSVLFALPIALAVARQHGRRVLWLLVPAGAVAVLLLAHNQLVFGNLLGGLGGIEAEGHAKHGVEGWIADAPLSALAGTLVSPSRGLFVFSPWAALALAALPWTRQRLGPFPVVRAALLGLVPFGLVISLYGVWWGGWSFGPRYWTEAMPLFGVLLGFALATVAAEGPVRLLFGAAVGVAIGLQTIGAFFYPSSWNRIPVSVDQTHERLWDWGDSEIRRCLEEGPHWPPSFPLPGRRPGA